MLGAANELSDALFEAGFKVGTERKWASGTYVKTKDGWVEKSTGKPMRPGGMAAQAVKHAARAGAVVAQSAATATKGAAQAKVQKAKDAAVAAPKVAKGLLAKIKGLPEKAKKFVTDRDYRAKAGKQMAEALRRKTTAAIKGVADELRELKDAGAAMKKIALRQKLGHSDKHALRGAAKAIATTLAGSLALSGGENMMEHLALFELMHHFVAEALVKHVGRAALFAHLELKGWPISESDDAAVEEVTERIIRHVLTKLEGLGDMSDEQIAHILSGAKGEDEEEQAEARRPRVAAKKRAGIKLIGEKPWDSKDNVNTWVPDAFTR